MAIAPEQTGIGIRRQFTVAGQDPYDSVVWERRDARISHYATGAVAFEQTGVEVPAGWSLNATNILAQKYFRGTLGAPEREWSLRQVADRVVDTITAWGRKDGYFVDDGEAQTFSDELKYLIIHQKAAFNSPVWFNIGVAGVPQQGSACFILSVDDSMDSILEWYKEEGIIFKGGSGAGVNLSRIRSSKEHLRGGGTASGPVSFMRGADASAGTIKCLDAETAISTSDGLVPIREVRVGTSVLTRSGPRPVVAVHDNGDRPLVRLRTALGEEIRCTPDHRFWCRTPTGEGWREAGQLGAGDAVLMDVSGVEVGRHQRLHPVQRGHHNELARTLPPVLDESFALWLGWLWGDGSITTGPSANFISVQIGDKDPELADRYRLLCWSLFGDVNVFESRHQDKADASASVRFCSTQVIRFLERNGLRKGASATLSIPAIVQSSPAPVRAAFLAGLFEADGHVANGYVGFSSISETLARDVQRVLLSLGIPSKRSTIEDRAAAFGTVRIHTVRVVGGEGQRRFAKHVGFVSERKSRRLEEAMSRKAISPFESQWVLPHAGSEIDELWQRADGRLRRALSPYCRFRAPRSMSLLRARALVDRFPTELAGTRLERFSFGDELWATVTVEADGEGPTFDLTVDGIHEYLVHNVVTHNSGGKTRRAAKMVILNVDHPDIEDFIWCKAVEERKARALRDAGFDMDLDGKDSHSIQYQNANNSIRVTDEFMHAVIDDADWDLKAVITGETVQTVRARDLFRQMAKATWECADPGMQFDTTINRWHTAPNSGRINGSNPCFTGDALVHTDKGLISFKELFARANEGESFGVWTHDATSPDDPQERVELTTPEAFMITGTNDIVRLRFDNGMEVRCTPGHRLFTTNRGYVEAGELTSEDRVKILDLPAPAVSADYRLPVSTDLAAYRQTGDHRRPVNLPEKWSPELGHYLGWLVGDGSVAATGTISAVYGSAEDRQAILPRHSELVTWLNGGQTPKPSLQANGTVQQRLSRRSLTAFFAALGLSAGRGPTKRVPTSIFQAPSDIVGSFLQGLFDADGCVRRDNHKGSYVGLGSSSRELLVDVQRLLSTLGVTSSIYATRKSAARSSFTYTRADGTTVSYSSSAMYELRISGSSVATFATTVGFALPSKSTALAGLSSSRVRGYYRTDTSAHLVDRAEDGYELTYNLSEPRNHSYVVNGLIVRNCSEYMHVDNSACNLASLNLLTFIEPDGPFDATGFKAAIEVLFTAQEILVGNADYPTEAIAENSRRFRQLGIGYANLGALLMSEGLAYDSDGGRAWAGAITALMTGHAYATSARTAARMGPFAGFTANRDATLNVLRMHRDAAAQIDEELVPPELLGAAQESWDRAVEIAEEYGVKNAQASVIAPTGTIGLLMDCDTTGLEPDLGLVKMKKLVGGGTMSIVNQTVPRALTRLGYDESQVEDILAYIDEHKSILGAPHLATEHLDVFACSMGDNTIHYRGHVRMMAAIQPFISGALSKTVNLPEEASVEDVEQLHIEAWQLGLKAVAIYRDNCKVAQPLATAKRTAVDPSVSEAEAHDAQLALKVADLEEALAKQTTVVVKQPIRERMPRRRRSSTFAFRVADCEGFVTVGEYEDGRPGEVFMKVAKQGSTLAGIMDAFAISVSLGLQHGVPLSTYVRKYTSMRFEPAGMTDDPDLRIAQSLVDYIFRRLAVDYMGYTERLELGVLTTQERTQPTLPGVDEAVTPNQSIVDDRLDLDGHSGPSTRDEGITSAVGPVTGAGPVVPPAGSVMPEAGDAPYCYQCGVQMQRAGSCHACPSCGTTSGCS